MYGARAGRAAIATDRKRTAASRPGSQAATGQSAGYPAEQTSGDSQADAAHLGQLRTATGRRQPLGSKLGVYVLEKKPNTFYRQRTYYRYDGGWSWSLSPDGPWQETDSSGVPGGLGRAFAQ